MHRISALLIIALLATGTWWLVKDRVNLYSSTIAYIPGPTFTIRARIVNWNEQPVGNTKLDAWFEALPPASEALAKGTVRASQAGHGFFAVTDADGMFQAKFSPRDKELKNIAIMIEDEARQARGWVEPIKVVANGSCDLGTVKIYEMREKYPTPIVQGQVTTESGEVPNRLNGGLRHSASDHFEEEFEAISTPSPSSLSREVAQVTFLENGDFCVYGDSTWSSPSLWISSPGFHSTRMELTTLPTTGLKLTLQEEQHLTGHLQVPVNGPSVQEYLVWVSHEDSRFTGVSPRTDGAFTGMGSNQSKNLVISHTNSGPELFRKKFTSIPSGGDHVGVIDLVPLVQVVDLTITNAEGLPRANQVVVLKTRAFPITSFEIDLSSHEFEYEFKTDTEGRLLTVLPAELSSLSIAKGNGDEVEITLPSKPSTVVLP